jgi:hypothetical protein
MHARRARRLAGVLPPAGDPPSLGGNLEGVLAPGMEALIPRVASIPSSIVTGTVLGAVAGAVAWTRKGEPLAVGGCTVRDGRIISMEILADPERIRQLDLEFLEADLP